MEISVHYYKLLSEKIMGDGNIIPKNQELILIKKDVDGMFFFETYRDISKKLFWTTQDEVELLSSSVEEWSDEKINERNRYINGEFI